MEKTTYGFDYDFMSMKEIVSKLSSSIQFDVQFTVFLVLGIVLTLFFIFYLLPFFYFINDKRKKKKQIYEKKKLLLNITTRNDVENEIEKEIKEEEIRKAEERRNTIKGV